MELMFESRSDIRGMSGELSFVQNRPKIHEKPVVVCDSDVDGAGTSIHGGTVINEGGKLRMWYQAYPGGGAEALGQNSAHVAYAESEDGIHWEKPNLNLFEFRGNKCNNLTNLGMHCPSVWIDPKAGADTRYRSLGCSALNYPGHHEEVQAKACYALTSPDGYQWKLDHPEGNWKPGKLISGNYHPGRDRVEVIIKALPFRGNIMRRSFASFHSEGNAWSEPEMSFIPDEYDDIQARERGGVSTDYMNLAFQASGQGMVGFLGRFRHRLPYAKMMNGQLQGINGKIDFGLAFQEKAGAVWSHPTGRPTFLSVEDAEWLGHCLFPSVSSIEIGDDHRLYFTNMLFDHGYCYGPSGEIIPERMQEMVEKGTFNIGFLHWPKHQLFGFKAEPQGEILIELGKFTGERELKLSHAIERGGSIRVELLEGEKVPSAHYGAKAVSSIPGYGLEDCRVMKKSSVEECVDWHGKTTIQGLGDTPLMLKVQLERSTLYGFELI